MQLRYLFFFILVVNQAYPQQNKYNFIIQNKANERLPFASLYWPRSAGFSANKEGVISITSDSPIDSIIVSSIGYKTIQTNISSLQKSNDSIVVVLTPQESILPSVTIFSKTNETDLGIQERQTSFISNNYRSLTGVVKIYQPNKICKIKSVSIFINKKSAENIPFRIRIFAITESGYPGEDLLRDNIVIESYSIGEWNTFYLGDSNIFIEHPFFFIGIEWLNQPQIKTKGNLQIGLTSKINEAQTYFQFANREWRIHRYINQPVAENLMIKTKVLF